MDKNIEVYNLEYKIKSGWNKYNHYSDDQLLDLLKKEILKIGTTKIQDYERYKNKDKMPTHAYFLRRFNCSWNNLLLKIGIEEKDIYNISRTDEEYLDILRKLTRHLGYPPSISDLKKAGYSEGIYSERFGNYNNALRKAGIEPKFLMSEVTETDEQLLKMYIDFSCKIGKDDIGASAMDLDTSEDIYNSGVFSIRFGGITELKKIIGFKVEKISQKKYKKEDILKTLKIIYKKNGGRLKQIELKDIKNLPSQSTILRFFKTTKMSDVWKEVENQIDLDKIKSSASKIILNDKINAIGEFKVEYERLMKELNIDVVTGRLYDSNTKYHSRAVLFRELNCTYAELVKKAGYKLRKLSNKESKELNKKILKLRLEGYSLYQIVEKIDYDLSVVAVTKRLSKIRESVSNEVKNELDKVKNFNITKPKR